MDWLAIIRLNFNADLIYIKEMKNEKYKQWMCSLFEKLLKNYGRYFSKDGTLNSDGRKLVENIIHQSVKRNPQLKQIARDLRREPTLNNVLKLAREFLSDEILDCFLKKGISMSYTVKKNRVSN